jgi:DUF1365 family protein
MTGEVVSGLYAGTVTHVRSRPKRHRLSYRIFMLLLDLDEIPGLCARLRLMSHRRFNLFSFHERDHADGSGAPLRAWVERHLLRAGIDLQGGAIRLLAMPRVLGYGFNPISVYFCHHRDGRLLALLHEVHNTFGERHSYLIPVKPGDGVISQSCAKEFHVSPFMAMGMSYDFLVHPPDETFRLSIRSGDAAGPMIFASFDATRRDLTRRDLTDRALSWAFVSMPLVTLKVIGGIHWEALRLWRKGLRLHPKPAAPADPVSIVALATPATI